VEDGDRLRRGGHPPRPAGIEIFYFNKDRGDAEAVLAAPSGRLIWEKNDSITSTCATCRVSWPDDIRKARLGWTADVHPSPGLESYAIYYWDPFCPNRHWNDTVWVRRLYSATGQVLGTANLQLPIDWDGQPPSETLSPPGTGSRLHYAADVIGDYREEFIVMLGNSENVPPHGMLVVTNTAMAGAKKASPCEKREYVIEKRWTGYR